MDIETQARRFCEDVGKIVADYLAERQPVIEAHERRMRQLRDELADLRDELGDTAEGLNAECVRKINAAAQSRASRAEHPEDIMRAARDVTIGLTGTGYRDFNGIDPDNARASLERSAKDREDAAEAERRAAEMPVLRPVWLR